MKRPRFTLTTLLWAVTIAAVGFWWASQMPQGHITERQAASAKSGMKIKEVIDKIGNPCVECMWTYTGQKACLHYHIRNAAWSSEIAELFVWFDPKSEVVESVTTIP